MNRRSPFILPLLDLSVPAAVRRVARLFSVQCGLIIAASFLAAVARGAPDNADFDASSPNIFVDYDRAKTPSEAEITATNGLGCWIWDRRVLDKQTIHLWKSFSIPKSDAGTHAELRISADNAFRVWIDGQEIGSGSDWRTLSIYDLSGQLNPGTHVLAVEGFNDCDKAGVIVGMRIKLASGRILHLQSDKTWHIIPLSVSGWRTMTQPSPAWANAAFIANLRQSPWWGVPKTVAHIQELLPAPLPFWRTSRFQFILFAGCGFFIVIGLWLLIQLIIQSKTHRFLQVERDRIARDIHDDLGSKITQLLLTGESSQIAPHAHSRENASAGPILQMCEEARDILTTIDEIIWIVNSQHNTLTDFANHVCKYTERFLQSSPIRFRFDVEYELPRKTLTQLARRNLILAVKEALNNVVKHSHATELTVRIKLEGSTFNVVVEDNGIGFDCRQVDPDRNGLNNMALRMQEIGGNSEIISRRGQGCKVCLTFPLKHFRFRPLSSRPALSNGSPAAHGLESEKEPARKQ